MQQLQSSETLFDITLKFDLNHLLMLFNEMDRNSTGVIQKKHLKIIMESLNIQENEFFDSATFMSNDTFEFDAMLSILGEIQVPHESFIYVFSFVKTLTNFRHKCVEEKGDEGLEDAEKIHQKVRKIINRELDRQRRRLHLEHHKIFDEMNKSQQKQWHTFEEQWKQYLTQFKLHTFENINKTKSNKYKELSEQAQKIISSRRKKSVITSPKLCELVEKKKRLVSERKYHQAIRLNHQIDEEKSRIEEHNQESLEKIMKKKINLLKKKNQNTMDYIQMQMTNNMNKLLLKKKQGENLMKKRMKNLQEEAQKKLNDHLRNQLARVKSLLISVSK